MQGKAGFDMTLTVGGVTIGKAQNVNLDGPKDEIETTTRDSGGWKEFINGLKEWTVTGTHLWVPDNAGMEAIRDSWLNNTEVNLQLKDSNGNGWAGRAIVTNIGQDEELNGAVGFPFTMRGNGALAPIGPAS